MASAPNHMMDAAWVPCISSLPFFLSLTHSLYSPSLLHYLRLYMSLFGYRGGLEHSFAQLPDHCMAVSSVFPSCQWHYIHTDIILSRLPFFPIPFFLFLPLALSLSLPLLLSPQELSSPLSPRAFCTPWLQSKRLGLSKANSKHPVP